MRRSVRAHATLLFLSFGFVSACSLIEASVIDNASRPDAAPDVMIRDATDVDAPEAAPTCVLPEGGAPCDPGFIDCPISGPASFTCEQASNLICCGGFNFSCVQADASGCFTSALLQCDETSDCRNGERCWGDITGNMLMTTCSATQPVGTPVRMCKSLTECGNCVVQKCKFNQIDQLVESCGGVSSMYCN